MSFRRLTFIVLKAGALAAVAALPAHASDGPVSSTAPGNAVAVDSLVVGGVLLSPIADLTAAGAPATTPNLGPATIPLGLADGGDAPAVLTGLADGGDAAAGGAPASAGRPEGGGAYAAATDSTTASSP